MSDFFPSFYKSFAIIFFSEIGDKTFIIIWIYATKLSWYSNFAISFLSLQLMNILSVCLGYLIPYLLVQSIVDWIGCLCFFVFGCILLKKAMWKDSISVEQKMMKYKSKKEEEYTNIDYVSGNDSEQIWNILSEFFLLLCLSELGDESEITTITIAAMFNIYGVLLGTFIAYTITIIIAISLGRWISKYITEKQMLLISGILFMLFALGIFLRKLGIVQV